jgi:hypothetical protein
MRAWIPALLCAVCAEPLAAGPLPKTYGQSPAEVANAELAFAKLAAEKGISAAFLATFAEGSRILNPEPTDARAHYAAEKDPGLLSWRPAWVGVASSGDLATSTGPWEYRVKAGQPPLAQGHFLSLWAKQADGTWKVVFDCGVPHAAQAEPEGWRSFSPSAPASPGGGEGALTAADRALSDGRSLAASLAFGATVYRRKALPLVDRGAVMAALSEEPSRRFEPQGARTAQTQDLGYTWGVATAADGSAVSYCHVWVRPSGVWQLLYDLELPLPAKKP